MTSPAPAPVNRPVTPATPASPASAQATTATSNAINGTSTTSDAVNSSLAGSAATQGDVSMRNGTMSSNANTNASANGQINGLATGAELSGNAGAALSPAETVRDIRAASQSSRDTVVSQVNTRIENTGRVISDLNRQARNLSGDAKTQFKAAMDDLHDKERSLRHSVNDVRKASNDNWSDAQARLASDYEAYATAVARAQAAASVNGTSTVR